MYSLLKSIVEEAPTAARPSSTATQLTATLRNRLVKMHDSSFDRRDGGLKMPIKFIDRDSVEFAMVRASAGSREEGGKATLTLKQSVRLIDARDGGVRAYVTKHNWHGRGAARTMAADCVHLQIYALAYALWRPPYLRNAACRIREYLARNMRSVDGTFVETAVAPCTHHNIYELAS